jgi:dipeptidyl aminopeptidase/acylaminoacyl peptidase
MTTFQSAAAPAAGEPTQLPRVDVTAAPPVEDYMKYPEFSAPVLSPNGKYLAVQVPAKGRLNLAVVDLETRSSRYLTGLDLFDVRGVRWVGNDRLIFSMGEQNTPTGPSAGDGGGLFMVSRDGKESRALSPTIRERRLGNDRGKPSVGVVAVVNGSDRELIVIGGMRSRESADLYFMDITTGKTRLITEDRPSRVGGYLLDRNQAPRLAFASVKDELESIIYFRAKVDGEWTELMRLKEDNGESEKFVPLAFDNDNHHLLVAANPGGRDTMAIYRYDPVARKMGEMVASHPRYDMGADAQGGGVPGLVIGGPKREVLGYRVDAERLETVWTDETMAKMQAMVDGALPNRVNLISRSEGAKALVVSYSDRTSPEFFIMDEKSNQIELAAVGMPWITEKHLVEQRPFLLKTRDGLEIPSYYFLPSSYKPGQKLPMVLHIHGGPFARADRWGPLWQGGFGVAEAQLLASRGYAVVVPNFRVTPGFGTKIYRAGFNSIGRQMSEDHEDAVKWAVAQGFADPNRVCISGASYGGYATLRALAKTPDMFRCGIAGLSVTDMELQMTSTSGDTAYNTTGRKYWALVLGENIKPGISREVSPVHQAAQMKAPILMYAGADDIRTPLEQTKRMQKALEAVDRPPQMIIKKEEGHGFGRLENRVDLANQMLEFLEKHIGVGPTL